MKKGFVIPLIIVIVAVAALVGAFYLGKKSSVPTATNPVVQTSPSPSCLPRPACLDATPRCMVPEPANGWCPETASSPKPTPTPTPDPTANWKTYIDPEGRFTFKYPQTDNWKLFTPDSPLGKWIEVICSDCTNQVDYFQVTPLIYKSIDDYLASPNGRSDFERIKINGADALKAAYAGSPSAGGSSIYIFAVYKGQGYEMMMRYANLYSVSSLKDFPKSNFDILSTFKFTQ